MAWVGYRSASNIAVNVEAGLSRTISVTWHAEAALLSSGAESCADPYTPPNSNPVQVCVAAATTQTMAGVVRTVATRSLQDGGAVPAPDWCSIDGQNFVIYRTEACGVFSGVLTVHDLNSGEVTGTMNFDYIDYAYRETDLPDWGHQVSVRVVSESGAAAGSSVQGDASCENSCQLDRVELILLTSHGDLAEFRSWLADPELRADRWL